jgi:hypothetical protein
MIEKAAIAELKAAIAKKRFGIYVGAGASIAGGLPSWSGLLKDMLDLLKKVPQHDPRIVADGKKALKDPANYLAVASVLRQALGNTFEDYFSQKFGKNAGQPAEVHRAVVRLPYQVVVTTNYDWLLERAYTEMTKGKDIPITLTYEQAGDIAYQFTQGNPFIIKAHGDAGLNPQEIVLSEQDYRKLIHHALGYRSVMQTIFTTTTFLFVGTSMTDPDLKLMLSFVYSAFHGKTPPHVALMPASSINAVVEKAYFENYRIRLVPIDDAKMTESIVKFMKKLS